MKNRYISLGIIGGFILSTTLGMTAVSSATALDTPPIGVSLHEGFPTVSAPTEVTDTPPATPTAEPSTGTTETPASVDAPTPPAEGSSPAPAEPATPVVTPPTEPVTPAAPEVVEPSPVTPVVEETDTTCVWNGITLSATATDTDCDAMLRAAEDNVANRALYKRILSAVGSSVNEDGTYRATYNNEVIYSNATSLEEIAATVAALDSIIFA